MSGISNEQRFVLSTQFAHIGFWEWDISSNEIVWSDNIAGMFGLDEELIHLTFNEFNDIIHPDDRELVNEQINNCISNGATYDVTHRIIQSDGEIRWMHEKGNVVRDDNGIAKCMLGIVRDVTAKKYDEIRTTKLLTELNHQKYAIDKHAIVATTDLNGVITYANDKFCEVSGYSKNELIGNTHKIVNSGTHPPSFFSNLWKTITSGNLWMGEICNRKKNGDYYWVATTIVPYLNEDGEIDHYTAIRQDITERVLALQKVDDERQLLNLISDIQLTFLREESPQNYFNKILNSYIKITNCDFGFVNELIDQSGTEIDFITRSCTDSTSASNNIDDAWHKKIHMYHQCMSKYDGAQVINECGHCEFMSEFPHSACLAIPIVANEELIFFIGLVKNEGEFNSELVEFLKPLISTTTQICLAYKKDQIRRHTEVELARFKMTLDRGVDTIFMFEPDDLTFIYVNKGAVESVGYSADELLTMTPADIKPDYSFSELKEMFQPLIIGPNRNLIFETVHKHKNGRIIPVEISLQYIDPLSDSPRFVAFIRDLTERNKSQLQLQQAHKMQAVGQLTAGIAHDFNNILASILGFNNLALNRYVGDDQPDLKEYLLEVSHAGERARDLISQLLTFSRSDVSQPINTSISPIIKEVGKLLKATIPSNINISYHINETPKLNIDPVALLQCLMNICINSRDAIDDAGNIDILVSHIHSDNIQTKCDSCHLDIEAGEYISITIRDDGKGISKDALEHIFEPFFTTKDIGKGTGMGLSIVHGVVHKNGGHICVPSDVTHGTSIQLIFPPSIASATDSENIESFNVDEIVLNKRILIIDDEEAIARFISELLVFHGAETTIMTNSQLAYDLIVKQPDSFDVVITDQTMPIITGTDLAKKIHMINPDLEIIVCSGYNEFDEKDPSEQLDIKAYLSKPIDVKRLLTVLTS